VKLSSITPIVVFIILSFFSCNKKTQKAANSNSGNAIETQLSGIKMIKTMCRGLCPEYTLEISEGGRMSFNGRKHVPNVGNFHAELSDNHALEIVALIDNSDFSRLDEDYSTGVMDLPSTYITYNDKTIRVQNRIPEGLKGLIEYLHALTLSTKWISDLN